jgi:putative addiction module killer protein
LIVVRETDSYARWFQSVRDLNARSRILTRVRRLSLGNPGDVAPVGEGVSELRISYGPGYRVYFVSRGASVVILLGGGDKGSQRADIVAAKKLARELEE